MGLCLRPLTASLPFAQQSASLLEALPPNQKVRGAYLARLLRFKMAPEVKAFWNQWLSEHKDLRADPASGLTFFHLDHDFVLGPCLDDAALALGMRKGADLGKFMQLWEHGVA